MGQQAKNAVPLPDQHPLTTSPLASPVHCLNHCSWSEDCVLMKNKKMETTMATTHHLHHLCSRLKCLLFWDRLEMFILAQSVNFLNVPVLIIKKGTFAST